MKLEITLLSKYQNPRTGMRLPVPESQASASCTRDVEVVIGKSRIELPWRQARRTQRRCRGRRSGREMVSSLPEDFPKLNESVTARCEMSKH